MAKLTRAQRKAKIAATIKVNGNKEITPPKDKILRDDEVDSVPSLKDGGFEFEQQIGYMTLLSITDDKSFVHKQYVDEAISNIPTGDFLPLDGSLPMEGSLNMDGFGIFNPGTIARFDNNNLVIGSYIDELSGLGSDLYFSPTEILHRVVGELKSVYYTLSVDNGLSLSTQSSPKVVNIKNDLTSFTYTAQLPAKPSGEEIFAMVSDISALSTVYEPIITAGTSTQYLRGDKTFQTLNTDAVLESGNLYYTQARVLAETLAGLSISGSSITSGSTVLAAFGALQNQINGLLGGATYQGVWNASTNSPSIASGAGTKGYYYVVSVAGSTNLDGITDWKVGDWAIFNGTTWDKVDNTDAVSSVNGSIGAISLTGTTNRITVTGNVWDIADTYVGQTSITTLGTIATGVWNGTLISPTYGGTGVNNGSKTITLGGNFTTTGAFNATFAIPQSTTWTLPNTASETLAGLATAQTFTANQTFSGLVSVTNTTDSTSTTNGAVVVSGGVGIIGSISIGGTVRLGGTNANFINTSGNITLNSGGGNIGGTGNGISLVANSNVLSGNIVSVRGTIGVTVGTATINAFIVNPTINNSGGTSTISMVNVTPTVTLLNGTLYGYYSNITAGSNVYATYHAGTAQHYFGDSNILAGASTGVKIGTSSSQKLGWWNATPITQPTTAITAATFVANTSGIVNDTATWDGYTIGQVVKALRNMGKLA